MSLIKFWNNFEIYYVEIDFQITLTIFINRILRLYSYVLKFSAMAGDKLAVNVKKKIYWGKMELNEERYAYGRDKDTFKVNNENNMHLFKTNNRATSTDL